MAFTGLWLNQENFESFGIVLHGILCLDGAGRAMCFSRIDGALYRGWIGGVACGVFCGCGRIDGALYRRWIGGHSRLNCDLGWEGAHSWASRCMGRQGC